MNARLTYDGLCGDGEHVHDWRRRPVFRAAIALPLSALLGACGDTPPPFGTPALNSQTLGVSRQAVTAGADGLADAYATFKQTFLENQLDQQFGISYAFHPGLSTEKLTSGGGPPEGSAVLDFAARRVTATLLFGPEGIAFDLWFVKNVAGGGRTVRPEAGDQFLKIGSFGPPPESSRCLNPGCQWLDVPVGDNVNFDLDLVVVTRRGKQPTTSRVAVGARTLFEKRFFRERAGRTLDPVSGTVASNVETTDALVGRGAALFFNETFGGNGRTCGTCHRADNNLTIDPAFIATLPQSDPLFVFENNPALAALEDGALLRTRGLVRENVDGFDDPTHKFVQRAVNHTFSLALTNGLNEGPTPIFPANPPDQRLGWGGDGAPGRGTLNEFAFGAIVQHFTKTLSRRPGVDFRIPTQEDLDALEAFQLFSGRQKIAFVSGISSVGFREPTAGQGRDLFVDSAQCAFCHLDFADTLINVNFNTGVVGLAPDLPPDDGFGIGALADGTFNVPPIVEAAFTPPLFHNNGAADVEAAVAFYVSDLFRNSPPGQFIDIELDSDQQTAVANFLRVIGAAEKIRQLRKRVQFVHDHRSAGNTDILAVAIGDAQTAINVLTAKNLNPGARAELADVKTTLVIARANADADRPPFIDHALVYLGLARSDLFTAIPDDEF